MICIRWKIMCEIKAHVKRQFNHQRLNVFSDRGMRAHAIVILMVVLFVGLCPSITWAQASESRWTNPDGGIFHKAGNWDAGVPDQDINSIFDIAAAYNVELETDAIVRSFLQTDGEIMLFGGNKLTLNHNSSVESGSLTLFGTGTILNNLSDFDVGQTGMGIVNITNGGALESSSGSLGTAVGATGRVTVSGANSRWNLNNAAPLSVGHSGIGELYVNSGGRVQTTGEGVIGLRAGSQGTANVNGQSSRLDVGTLFVGSLGDGTLDVGDGGTATSIGAVVGSDSASKGNIFIGGPGSTFENTGLLILGSGGDGGLEIESGGSVVTESASLGHQTGSVGDLSIVGNGSSLEVTANSSDNFSIGNSGEGTFNISDGGSATTRNSKIGREVGSLGTVTIRGTNSKWDTGILHVGDAGTGNLNIEDGGQVIGSTFAQIGNRSGGDGSVLVDGAGSILDVQGLAIGSAGRGELSLRNGGQLRSRNAYIGANTNSAGFAFIEGAGSLWDNHDLGITIAENGRGEMTIADGGTVSANGGISIGRLGNGQGHVVVDGTGSSLTAFHVSVGEASRFDVTGGATVTAMSGFNLVGAAKNNDALTARATVSGVGSSWITSNVAVGDGANGILQIADGGFVSGAGTIGRFNTGQVQIVGAGSRWDMGGSAAKIGWGGDGHGILTIVSSGRANAASAAFGEAIGSTGELHVEGIDSSFETSQQMTIGSQGEGSLNIVFGGRVLNRSASLGATDRGSATALVFGPGSRWDIDSSLSVGTFGDSVIQIAGDGLIRVGLDGLPGSTVIGNEGRVEIDGGRFEFGNMSLESLSRVGGSNGSLAGSVEFSGYRSITTLNLPTIDNLDTSEVLVKNTGVIHGDGVTSLGLHNTSDGEVRTRLGEWTRFSGFTNTNAGELNNFGGLLEFDNDLTNVAGGFIGGRGQFIVNGGLTNEGIMAFSAGVTDILGDVTNLGNGQIVTSGFGSTTFFDDVVHNGAEIRTAGGSATIFLGGYSGATDFTGTGDVFFEGDLRPGNSPDVVRFEGNVFLSDSLESTFELAGLGLGEFDMLDIAGDLSLDGNLSVELIDGFHLEAGNHFLIAQAGGNVFGQFNGLDEGDLVGIYGGRDLFITYSAGNGNDVGLFTAVPEPGSISIAMSAICLIMLRRRR